MNNFLSTFNTCNNNPYKIWVLKTFLIYNGYNKHYEIAVELQFESHGTFIFMEDKSQKLHEFWFTDCKRELTTSIS